jgi:hypothetical protein
VKVVGEFIEVIAERAGLKNIREVGEWLKNDRRTAREQAAGLADSTTGPNEVIGSDVLDFGQAVIAAMKGTTGDGEADTGARFGHGHTAFNKTGETLQSAVPNDSWDGSSSRTYADQNTRQQLRTETMADADLEVHRVLFREAAQITLRRGFLDDQSNFLAYTSYATFPLSFIKTWGEAAKLKIELNALQAALSESAYQMYQLHAEVNANATELQQAIGRYRSVVDGAEMPRTDVDFGPPPLPRNGSSSPTIAAQPATGGGTLGAPAGSPATGGAAATPAVDVPAAVPRTPIVEPIVEPISAAETPPAPSAPFPSPLGVAPVAAAAGPLGAMISPLAGLVTSAALAAARRDGEDHPGERDAKKKQVEDTAGAGGHSERVPIAGETDSGRDRPSSPATVRLDPGTSPGPPAGKSPQDTK